MNAPAAAAVTLPPEIAALRDEAVAAAAAENLTSPAPPPAPGAGQAEPGAAAEVDPAAGIAAAADLLAKSGAADVPDTWEDWVAAIDMALDWFADSYPELNTVYTTVRKERLAKAMHALAKKYGWTMAGLFLKFKEEITLLLVARPLLRDTQRVLAKGRVPPPPAAAAAAPRSDVLRHNE